MDKKQALQILKPHKSQLVSWVIDEPQVREAMAVIGPNKVPEEFGHLDVDYFISCALWEPRIL